METESEVVTRLDAKMTSVERDIADLRADLRAFRGETIAEFRSNRSDSRSDFRTMFGALIVSVLSLAGLMARGFHWL